MKETNPSAILAALVRRAGTQTAAAKELGISIPYLNDILNGRRDFSRTMLAKLGLKKIVVKQTSADTEPVAQ